MTDIVPERRDRLLTQYYNEEFKSVSSLDELKTIRSKIENAFYWSRHDGTNELEHKKLELRWNAAMTRWNELEGDGQPRWTYRYDRRNAFSLEMSPENGTVIIKGRLYSPDTTINWRSHTVYGAGRGNRVQGEISSWTGDDAGHLAASQFGTDPEGVNAGEARPDRPITPDGRLNYALQNRVMNEEKGWKQIEDAVAAAARKQVLYLMVESHTVPRAFAGEREAWRKMTVSLDPDGREPISVKIKQQVGLERKQAADVGVKLSAFTFGNFDSPERREALESDPKRKLFMASRLSTLAYLPFDQMTPEGARARTEIREAVKLFGFNKVEFCANKETNTQALIAFNSQRSGAFSEKGQAFVVFRGSVLESFKDLQTNLSTVHAFDTDLYGTAGVHSGYHNAVKSIQEDLKSKLDQISRSKAGLTSVSVAGHSQAGAEAQLYALWAARDGHKIAGVYSFGAPHVSDHAGLAEQYLARGIPNMNRVERIGDPITALNTLTPLPYSNALGGREPGGERMGRLHVGSFISIDQMGNVVANPPGEQVIQNALEVGPTIEAHSQYLYDRDLFLNMNEKDKTAWRERLFENREKVERQFNSALPESPNFAKRGEFVVKYNVMRREQAATKGQEWSSQPDIRSEVHPQPNPAGVNETLSKLNFDILQRVLNSNSQPMTMQGGQQVGDGDSNGIAIGKDSKRILITGGTIKGNQGSFGSAAGFTESRIQVLKELIDVVNTSSHPQRSFIQEQLREEFDALQKGGPGSKLVRWVVSTEKGLGVTRTGTNLQNPTVEQIDLSKANNEWEVVAQFDNSPEIHERLKPHVQQPLLDTVPKPQGTVTTTNHQQHMRHRP